MDRDFRSCTALAREPLPAPAPALRRVAQVRGLADYGCPEHRYPYPRWIAARTLAGAGAFDLARGGRVRVGADDLLLVRQRDLRGFTTAQAPWDVWWYEFLLADLPLPEQTVLHLPGAAGEVTTGIACQRLLAQHTAQARMLASARFTVLLCGWASQHACAIHPDGDRADRVLAAMHERTDGGLSLAELSRIAGVGGRRLRDLLIAATGLPPARCYARIRAAQGMELVRLHGVAIADAARQCGFGDRQTFTRACRRLLGTTPGAVRSVAWDPGTQPVAGSASTPSPSRSTRRT